MKGAHFPPTFPHPRFLLRKRGKGLCAKLRFASGDAALRDGRGRSVLSSDGKNQRSPGDGSDERLRGAGAHSYLSPGPPFTRVCPFGLCVIPGGQNQDLFLSYSRAIGPYFHENVKGFPSNAHRLVHPYLFGAAVVGWTNCHGYARVGGAISAQYQPNFAYKGPKARGKWYYRTCFRTAGKLIPRNQERVSRNGGPGGGLTMSASKGAALIGRTPLGASLVTFCASRK